MLSPARLDLWCCRRDSLDETLRRRYRAALTDAEREQEMRFRFEHLRDRYLTTRALVRAALSHYAGCDPAAWRFRPGEFGRPRIVEPEGFPLDFNLSHTDGLIVCGIATGEMGVDVESVDRRTVPLALARRFFAPSEADALERLAPAAQPARFLEYWTLKESYIKARGKGLAIPLDHFAFVLSADAPPRISFVPGFDDEPAGWHFGQIQLSAAHELAWAMRLPQGAWPEIAVCDCLPLEEQGPLRVLPPEPSHRWQLGGKE